MKLSKYVIMVKDKQQALLYNTINEAIVILDVHTVSKSDDSIIVDVSAEDSLELKAMKYSCDEKTVLKNLINERSNTNDTLIITVSITQMCNLACLYCSQNDSKTNGIIKKHTIDDIVKYIVVVFRDYNYKKVAIDFFGGEPLLGKDEILYFKNNIERYIEPHKLSYAIDTNGVLLDREYLSNFEQVNINLTLTRKPNHDKLRCFPDNRGSYDIIINNLMECADLFDQINRQLRIRYNVSDNTGELDLFIKEIKKIIPNIEYIEIAPVINHRFNKYQSSTSLQDYADWYTNDCIDILVRNNIYIDFPKPRYSLCRAYTAHSIKINYDGQLTLCSGMQFDKRKSDISLMANNPNKLHELFKEKNVSPYDNECHKCKYIYICGGKQFCKGNDYCNFLEYDLKRYLLKYLEYSRTTMIKYFSTS